MSWAKLDDNFHMHPKTLAVGNAGAGLFARMLSWSCNHLTDGVVTGYAAVTLAGTDGTKLVDELVRVGWLEPQGDGSYKIHDFGKYNPPADIERRKREKNAEKQAKHRAKSTRSKAGTFESNQGSNRVTNRVTESVTNHGSNQVSTAVSNSVPVPVPVPNSETHTPQAREATRTEPVTVPPVEARARALTAGQTQILEALQAHPALAQIATDRFASNLDGTLMTASFTLADMLAGIAELGPHAAGDAALGKPRLDTVLGKQVITYAKNLSERRKLSPRSDAPRGQGGAKVTAVQPRSPNADKWPSLDLLAGVDTTVPDFDPFDLLPEGYPKK